MMAAAVAPAVPAAPMVVVVAAAVPVMPSAVVMPMTVVTAPRGSSTVTRMSFRYWLTTSAGAMPGEPGDLDTLAVKGLPHGWPHVAGDDDARAVFLDELHERLVVVRGHIERLLVGDLFRFRIDVDEREGG